VGVGQVEAMRLGEPELGDAPVAGSMVLAAELGTELGTGLPLARMPSSWGALMLYE